MKIAILGAGKVGGALGKKWSNAGHTIRFGVRDTHKPQVQELVQSLGANVSATNIAEAIDFGDVVLFAITGTPMDEMITANAQALGGKIIIDAANKFNVLPMNSLATFAAQAPTAIAHSIAMAGRTLKTRYLAVSLAIWFTVGRTLSRVWLSKGLSQMWGLTPSISVARNRPSCAMRWSDYGLRWLLVKT